MTHYYSEKQEGPFEPFKMVVRLKDMTFEMLSASGIFSKKKLDKGTECLLTYMALPEEKGAKVLDLGCGVGVVGIVAKKRRPDLELVQSDVNERAVKLTEINNKKLGTGNKVVQSDLFANEELLKEGPFDLILVNPPYVAGRKLITRMIQESFAHLAPGGELQLVARHNKGGKVLAEIMADRFGPEYCDHIGIMAGYRVYRARKEK